MVSVRRKLVAAIDQGTTSTRGLIDDDRATMSSRPAALPTSARLPWSVLLQVVRVEA